MGDRIRIIVADDHEVVRKGIREYLEDEPDMEVVAEARDGEEAVAKVDALHPDVVVLDIQMPNVSGVEATSRIKAHHPDVKVLILTAYDNDPYIFALLKAGASGYLLKTAGPDDLVRAVRVVNEGQSWLGPEIARRVTAGLAGGRLVDTHSSAETELTQREMEVLRLAARGQTNAAIAHALTISERTAQGHLANILAKMGAANRTEAVLIAMKRGWIGLEDVAE
jgi:NarL family two-component system response regulator LiaR